MTKRRIAAVLLVVAAVLSLAGCAAISASVDTQRALQDAGYQSVSVSLSNGGNDDISVRVKVDATPTESDVVAVAQIVWEQFHERFADVTVKVEGQGPSVQEVLAFQQLQDRFGARNPAWNRTSVHSSLLTAGLVFIAIVAAVIAIVVVIVIVATRRKRRRRDQWWQGAQPAWTYGPQPGYPPYPYQGYPAAAYPPPTPGYPPTPPSAPPQPQPAYPPPPLPPRPQPPVEDG